MKVVLPEIALLSEFRSDVSSKLICPTYLQLSDRDQLWCNLCTSSVVGFGKAVQTDEHCGQNLSTTSNVTSAKSTSCVQGPCAKYFSCWCAVYHTNNMMLLRRLHDVYLWLPVLLVIVDFFTWSPPHFASSRDCCDAVMRDALFFVQTSQ